MSEMRVSDPSKLHLKRELTQIKKAARVLRDPGTTSSWKSPLTSTRSTAAAALVAASASPWKSFDGATSSVKQKGSSHLHSQFEQGNGKEKRVFLYNWKQYKSSSEKSGFGKNEEDAVADSDSSSRPGSADDSLSDARNGGDSKSDSFLGGSASMIFRCTDSNILLAGMPSARRSSNGKKKNKRRDAKLDNLSRYQQQKDIANLVKSKRMSRDEFIEQSDDTEDYYNSEDLKRVSAASPLLLKLKHKNWAQSSSKLKSSLKDDSSYTYSTPAFSTSSFNRYGNRNPSVLESWDSLNEGDDDMDDHLDLPGSQGCGIPCYWSRRTPKHKRGCGSCYSPSLSDTLKRKGTSILCGSQMSNDRRRRSVSSSRRRRIASKSAQGVLPLLANSGDGPGGSSLGTGYSDDELSTNYGELDLEALSRLDGRRWSTSCRSQDSLEIATTNGDIEEEGSPENLRSLTKKYKPMFFSDVIGQNIVVQSLINAVQRGRIASVYLFQGPRGTGKSSTARIFASALNCLGPLENKPCGYCRECTDFMSGKSRDLWELDATNKKGIDRLKYYMKSLLVGSPSAFNRYKVFVIDECHLLSSKAWLAFLKFLEESPPRVVFVFITTDLDNVPRTVQSRCQKYIFNKIKESDIVARLKKISANENLDVESDALDLIAVNADGSLRDAETMLDQLSLLGKRITTSLVNELVGVVSDEKLLELLEFAMSSDTAGTVKRARELMDSGVDPIVLMSQLASLIMDIIAGTYNVTDPRYSLVFGGRNLTEAELEKLKHALKLLSEAEKQLRVSSERSTWFTATLLQLGSSPSADLTQSTSSRRQSSKTTDDDPSTASRDGIPYRQKSDANNMPWQLTPSPKDGFDMKSREANSRFISGSTSTALSSGDRSKNMTYRYVKSDKLDDIWKLCIEKCHSKTLQQLLNVHGKLVSLSEVEGIIVAYIAFGNGDIKSRAERFLSSITNSMEIVLRRNVDVRLVLLPEGGEAAMNSLILLEAPDGLKQNDTVCTNSVDSFDLGLRRESRRVSRGSFNEFDSKMKAGIHDYANCSPSRDEDLQSCGSAEANSKANGSKGGGEEIPMQRIESIIREQRLETAWLQAAEKGTPGSLSRLRPEKNQVLPQDGIYHQEQLDSQNTPQPSNQQWEDELNRELKALRINDGKALQKDQIGRFPMSPSLLHDSNLVGQYNKDNMGYESGTGSWGCSGLFCWKGAKRNKRGKVKGTPVRSRRGGRFRLFGECGKGKKSENRSRR